MPSQYVIQVVDTESGKVAEWAPGMAIERQLLADLGARVAAKGVGIGRTTAHVIQDVQTALVELLYDLKSDV